MLRQIPVDTLLDDAAGIILIGDRSITVRHHPSPPHTFGTRPSRPPPASSLPAYPSGTVPVSTALRRRSLGTNGQYSRSQFGLSALPRFTSRLVTMYFLMSSSRRLLTRFLRADHRLQQGRYPVSCTTRMPCRRVMRAAGQRATAAR